MAKSCHRNLGRYPVVLVPAGLYRRGRRPRRRLRIPRRPPGSRGRHGAAGAGVAVLAAKLVVQLRRRGNVGRGHVLLEGRVRGRPQMASITLFARS